MAEDPLLPFMEEVTEIGDELKEAFAEVEVLKPLESSWRMTDVPDDVYLRSCPTLFDYPRDYFPDEPEPKPGSLCGEIGFLRLPAINAVNVTFCSSESPKPLFCLTIVRVTVVIIRVSAVYRDLVDYIDRGGSKRGSSTSLDFRDIYISIVLFQAAYVWIKFRDVILRGAVYQRCGSNKWEPRIKFPVKKGTGCTSKRIPLGSYGTLAEGEVAYRIAAFYCNKRQHTGRLDLGGGASFPIPAFNVDPDLPYEEKVKQIGDQVLRVYAEFEEQKASRNLSLPGLALEMQTGEGELLTTSPIQHLQEPLNSRMELAMQGQGSQLDSNIQNGIDFNNPSSVLPVLVEAQYELLDAHKQIECLKARVS